LQGSQARSMPSDSALLLQASLSAVYEIVSVYGSMVELVRIRYSIDKIRVAK